MGCEDDWLSRGADRDSKCLVGAGSECPDLALRNLIGANKPYSADWNRGTFPEFRGIPHESGRYDQKNASRMTKRST